MIKFEHFVSKLSLLGVGIFLILCSAAGAQEAPIPEEFALEPLIEADPLFTQQYLIELSGTVNKERFNGAQALLSLSGSSTEAWNPYLIIFNGYPRENSRNSFFWNSEGRHMEAVANEITCNITRAIASPPDIYFIYLSPILLEAKTLVETHRDWERRQQAEKVALPTLVFVEAGQLKLRIYAETVSGNIWMKGYDKIERAYVLYTARFFGRKTTKLEPMRQIGK